MNLTKKQTEKLIKACINNDRNAQEVLYKLYYADMLRVCINYLTDRELAREAFNTGFLKVFESIKNYDPAKGEFGSWIRKIMIFSAIDLYRAELKFSGYTTSLPEEEVDFISSPVLEKLYFEDILRHIRTLPVATQ